MAIDYSVYKNDTARQKAARKLIAESILPTIKETFGDEFVVFTEKKLIVPVGDEGEGTVEFPAGSIIICTGQTPNKLGATVDVVATVSVQIKSFNTVKDKRERITWAVNFDEVLAALNDD